MALVLDTRFLIAHTFPPTREDRDRIKLFTARIRREKLYIPSIVLVEYLKVAGRRIGGEAARVRLRSWINAGAEVIFLSEESAFKAGNLSLRNPRVPLADIIIAAIAATCNATIVSDDPHFSVLGARTIWYK